MRGINFQYTGVHVRDAIHHLVVGPNGCTWANSKIRLQTATLHVVLRLIPILACKHTIRHQPVGLNTRRQTPLLQALVQEGCPP